MLDLKYLRENPDIVKGDLRKRGDMEKCAWVDDLLGKDRRSRALKVQADEPEKAPEQHRPRDQRGEEGGRGCEAL